MNVTTTGSALGDHRITWRSRPIFGEWHSWDCLVDDEYVPQELLQAADEIEEEDLWHRWIIYWMEKPDGGEESRLAVLFDAQVRFQELGDKWESERRRRKNDPERLTPEELQELAAAVALAGVTAGNLEETGMAMLEGREAVLYELTETAVEAQYAMTDVLAAAPPATGARTTRAAPAPRMLGAPAEQASLFA